LLHFNSHCYFNNTFPSLLFLYNGFEVHLFTSTTLGSPLASIEGGEVVAGPTEEATTVEEKLAGVVPTIE
jgi:hypothetical protein